MLVIIESPYAGTRETNIAYARRALLDSLKRGESPFASHLLYTQVLDDSNREEREQGIAAGLRLYAIASLCAVYSDMGVSPGMLRGIEQARLLAVPVEYRSIGW